MLPLLNNLRRIARRLEIITLDLCVALTVIMCVVLLAELVARNVFSSTFLWSMELATTCFVWVAFLGATAAIRQGEHFSVDLIGRWATEGSALDHALKILTAVIIIAFGMVLLWKGFGFAANGMRRFSFSLGIPQGYTMLIMPISGALILFYGIIEMLQLSLRGWTDKGANGE